MLCSVELVIVYLVQWPSPKTMFGGDKLPSIPRWLISVRNSHANCKNPISPFLEVNGKITHHDDISGTDTNYEKILLSKNIETRMTRQRMNKARDLAKIIKNGRLEKMMELPTSLGLPSSPLVLWTRRNQQYEKYSLIPSNAIETLFEVIVSWSLFRVGFGPISLKPKPKLKG